MFYYWWSFYFLYIFLVGGVGCVYMCGIVIGWGRLCFEFVCQLEYMCALFSAFVYLMFFAFLLLVMAPQLPMRTL